MKYLYHNKSKGYYSTKHDCNGCKKRVISTGFGDTVKKIIAKVTRGKIKPCGGCKKRQELLNKLLPYSSGGNDVN
jgi:hypothetical protein